MKSNKTAEVIKKFFNGGKQFENLLWPTAVSIFAIGGMIGALVGPHFAKRFGRKKTLIANNFIAIIAGVFLFLTKTTNSIYILIVGRFLIGIDAGINTVVAPMYLSEVAPVNLRGSLGTLNQFGIVTGLLISQVLGLEMVLGTEKGWPYLFGITAFVAIAQLCVLPFCPESPRYLLIIQEDEEEAERALRKLRGVTDVSADIDEMKTEKEQEDSESKVSIIGLFKSPVLRRPLIISIVLQLSQQLCGINGVLFYSTDVFKNVGLSLKNAQLATTGVGAVSVIMTAIVVRLVEIQGRRTLMLWGLGGMFVFYICMTIAFVQKVHAWARWSSIILTLVLVIFFQLGPGPIPWFIVAELFSQGPLPAAISVSGMTNWLSSFIVGITFPGLQEKIKPYTFVPFIVLVLLFWLFTKFFVPETKGRTVNDIMRSLEKKSYGSTEQGEIQSSKAQLFD
ncbi:solute carrier family 2, facilitated glucose transporter member 3-like isoform X2 [Rhopilema esculentum]|uniref:solute carrier family 2, facilitated glucose transporter member 3-like isoform X2 n=1 Tax=Rhopilema esculentum TaxID=499914 RepID=UPI0031D7C10C